jgi:hypothetical protein
MKLLLFASMAPIATANYFVRAFRDMGHEVLVCSDVRNDLADIRVTGAVDVLSVLTRQAFEPDVVLFFEGGSMQLLPVGLDRVTCLTAWYGIDTHMDYAKHLCIGRLFDVSFIAQKEYVERLRQDGLRQVHWLPLGFAPELMPSPMPERQIDIAYVGSGDARMNPLRHTLMSVLRREFSSTHFGPATPQEMGRLYASARLVFNRSVKNDVNMRFFEAAGAGAVLVTDPIVDNGVEELFEEGEHYVVYRDEASLLRVIRDLLADTARCSKMGESARRRVLERHTYRHRARSILKVLEQSEKGATPRAEDVLTACLSLDLLSGALHAMARATRSRDGGLYLRSVGATVAMLLGGLARVLGAVEWARSHRKV